jgi:multisubunit Na+/H+ antiporter MnhG subunit
MRKENILVKKILSTKKYILIWILLLITFSSYKIFYKNENLSVEFFSKNLLLPIIIFLIGLVVAFFIARLSYNNR